MQAFVSARRTKEGQEDAFRRQWASPHEMPAASEGPATGVSPVPRAASGTASGQPTPGIGAPAV